MPKIYMRHAETGKNKYGGVDDPSTPLHEDGWTQAEATGMKLVEICKRLEVKSIQPIVSCHIRTRQTWETASIPLAKAAFEILQVIEDDRIGELKFRPRDFMPTADNPGLFGRVIEGATLAEKLDAMRSFDAEQLGQEPADRLVLVVGHRSTTRLLAMVHAGQTLEWLETLPRMHNCELWLARPGGIEILDAGYKSDRDEFDPRRHHFPASTTRN